MMISAWWLFLAFVGGVAFGVFLIGLLAGSKDDRR